MPPIDSPFEIVPGSIAHTAIQHGGQLPKPPIMVVMFDISYSMDERDATLHGRTVSRYGPAWPSSRSCKPSTRARSRSSRLATRR